MRHPIIAIDGTAASGKGTLARRLATTLQFACLDTGALYRYVALHALRAGLALHDEPSVTQSAQALVQRFDPVDLGDPALRDDATGQAASVVSAYPGVRQALFDLQRHFAAAPPVLADGRIARGAILDGRDIGTVICPDADLKLFITARIEIRSARRFAELRRAGSPVSYDKVLADMTARDKRDAEREAAPMQAAKDAILIDTSDMDIDAVFAKVLQILQAIPKISNFM